MPVLQSLQQDFAGGIMQNQKNQQAVYPCSNALNVVQKLTIGFQGFGWMPLGFMSGIVESRERAGSGQWLIHVP